MDGGWQDSKKPLREGGMWRESYLPSRQNTVSQKKD